MKKTVMKLAAMALAVCAVTSVFAGCGGKNENQVVIYTAAEDYRVKSMQDNLNRCYTYRSQYDSFHFFTISYEV